MHPTLRNLRKTSASPILAMGLSALLVLAQVFNCCRVNEAVAARLGHAVEHLGELPDPEMCEGRVPLVQQHAACHGAAPEGHGGEAHPIQSDEPCLAEADLTFKGVEPGSPASLSLLPVQAMRHALPVPRMPTAAPRAPEASGTPTYLLTLRLLV